MTKVLTRRDWLRQSGVILGGTALVGPGVMASTTPTARRNRAPIRICLLYTSPSPRDQRGSRMAAWS